MCGLTTLNSIRSSEISTFLSSPKAMGVAVVGLIAKGEAKKDIQSDGVS